jgi:hypothetical protein
MSEVEFLTAELITKMEVATCHISEDWDVSKAGLVLCLGYVPGKCRSNRTENSHLKRQISRGLGVVNLIL